MDRVENVPLPSPSLLGHTKEIHSDASEEASRSRMVLRYLRSVLNLIHHMLAAVVVFHVAGYALGDPTVVSLQRAHVILCVIGYQIILFEGIVGMSPDNKTTNDLSVKGKKVLHLIVQSVGCVLVVIGISIQIYSRGGRFQTTHGILGLVSLICTLAAALSSIPALFAFDLRSVIKPAVSKFLHISFGVAAFTFGIVTLCLGLHRASFRNWSSDIVANIIITLAIHTILFAMVSPMISMYQYIKKSF